MTLSPCKKICVVTARIINFVTIYFFLGNVFLCYSHQSKNTEEGSSDDGYYGDDVESTKQNTAYNIVYKIGSVSK